MSHKITEDYLRAALEAIEMCRGRFSNDALTYAENTVDAMKKIAHDALNGEWDGADG